MLRLFAILHHSRRDARSGSRWRVFVAALLMAITALVLAPTVSASASESGSIHSFINQARAAAGLAPLTRNASLDQVAANWANQLAASGQLAHNPSYSAQIPGGWTNVGENVAQGQPTGAAMHDAWMASSGHRANILGAFTNVGIAFIAAGGTTWGVEVFVAYPGSAPAAPPPAAPPAPRAAAQPAAPQAAEAAAAQAAAEAAAQAAAAQAAAAQQAAEAAAAQQAAEAAAAQAAIDAITAEARAEQTRIENRLRSDRTAAALTPTAVEEAAGYVPPPASIVAVALAVITVVLRMLAQGSFRARLTLR